MNGSRSVALWASLFVLVLAAAAQPVLSGDTVMRRGGPRQGLPDHVAAFAALEPVGGETGWGRIVVRDDLLPSGLHRSVQVWLHGLQPQMPYQVEAQGVVLGTVRTDRQGHAWLKLQSSGQGHDVVPEALPPAGDIVSAQVRDELLAPALEGTFSVVRHHEADLVVYEDKTELEDVTGGDAVGMACVRVKQSGAQQLVTRASRLVPGEVFRVVVDGVLAGVVTADEEGQAWLELESPDDDNPLPLELQPVTEIELVQWFHDDSVLLMGSFSGEDEDDDDEEEECEEVRGVVVEVGEDGFLLQTPAKVVGRTVKVAVTEETRFKGFEELAELDAGDVVVVEGCWDGEVLVAKWVALAEDDGEECEEVRGVVVEVGDEGFLIEAEGRQVAVAVTEETIFKRFARLDELDQGDFVVVGGCLLEGRFVAEWVLLVADDDEECEEVRGAVVEVGDKGFVLQTPAKVVGRTIRVAVTAETRFKEFESLSDLDAGDVVVVEGCWDGEVLVASWVLLAEDDDTE